MWSLSAGASPSSTTGGEVTVFQRSTLHAAIAESNSDFGTARPSVRVQLIATCFFPQ